MVLHLLRAVNTVDSRKLEPSANSKWSTFPLEHFLFNFTLDNSNLSLSGVNYKYYFLKKKKTKNHITFKFGSFICMWTVSAFIISLNIFYVAEKPDGYNTSFSTQ